LYKFLVHVVISEANAIRRFSRGTLPSPSRCPGNIEESKEGYDGKRNFAVAAGRADPGDHSAVAVFRPLDSGSRMTHSETRFTLFRIMHW
jgi:hypothetical protein